MNQNSSETKCSTISQIENSCCIENINSNYSNVQSEISEVKIKNNQTEVNLNDVEEVKNNTLFLLNKSINLQSKCDNDIQSPRHAICMSKLGRVVDLSAFKSSECQIIGKKDNALKKINQDLDFITNKLSNSSEVNTTNSYSLSEILLLYDILHKGPNQNKFQKLINYLNKVNIKNII